MCRDGGFWEWGWCMLTQKLAFSTNKVSSQCTYLQMSLNQYEDPDSYEENCKVAGELNSGRIGEKEAP